MKVGFLLSRERVQRQVIDALQQLTEHYEDVGNHKQAIALIQRMVELEPWREESHQRLMMLLAQEGERSAALAQYALCGYFAE